MAVGGGKAHQRKGGGKETREEGGGKEERASASEGWREHENNAPTQFRETHQTGCLYNCSSISSSGE
eukprot:359266-Rhodomonas_salina.1